MDTAYFVRYPRTVDDLRIPHLLNQEHPYEIVRELTLENIDYENFINDMGADRGFLEPAAKLCSWGGKARCLLIRSSASQGSVLVVPDAPEHGAHVLWAAYIGRWALR